MNPESAFSRPNQVEATFGESFDNEELGPIPEDFEEAMAAIMNIVVERTEGSSENSEAEPDRLERLRATIEKIINTIEQATGDNTNRDFFKRSLFPALKTKVTEMVDVVNSSEYTEQVAQLLSEQALDAKERKGLYGNFDFPQLLDATAKNLHERANKQRREEALAAVNEVQAVICGHPHRTCARCGILSSNGNQYLKGVAFFARERS